MHKTLEMTLNSILRHAEVHGGLCNEKTVLQQNRGEKGLCATSPTRIALALLATFRQLSIFSDVLARAIDKAFVLIDVSLYDVATFFQTQRDAPAYRITRKCVLS